MSLIEGVGDEVTNFFIVMSMLLVGWLAWCSTSTANQPLMRTVFIVSGRRSALVANPAMVANQINPFFRNRETLSRPPNLETTEEETEISVNDSDVQQQSASPDIDVDTSETIQETRPIESVSEEVLIETMDSFNNDDSSLLHRPIKTDNSDATSTLDQNTCSSTSDCRNDSNVNCNEITIKLKFINDDQKLVTGSLKEMIGDFKRRHFQMELEAHKSVRLVFNGHVLQPDTRTLEQCGLFNDCVVHCWVHQPRPVVSPSSASSPTSTLDNSSSIYFNPQSFSDLPTGAGINSVHNEWDLSRLLVSILTIILGLAWYSRYHYAQLFTATTTLALYALTAIFTVSLFSNFFPDQDNIRNVE